MEELHLWRWRYTDDFGRRRIFPCLLTEQNALASLRDPVKVDGSLEVRRSLGHTSGFASGQAGER
jgi:hypothetical protein